MFWVRKRDISLRRSPPPPSPEMFLFNHQKHMFDREKNEHMFDREKK